MKETLNAEYFEWLCHFIGFHRHRKLLAHLHHIEFRYYIPMDGNRFEDGINLRYRFADEKMYHYRYISACLDDKNCSVFEMMVALALRIEETITYDPQLGDRTYIWFKTMLESMGIYGMDDDHYDKSVVDIAVQNMLDRNYGKNGKGGLFCIRDDRKKDMRKAEIWYQANWYLDEVLEV